MPSLKEQLSIIEKHVRLIQPEALWDADDIASYLRLSKSTVQSRIIKSHSFPKPIIIPNSGGKRWQADLV